MSSWIKEHLPEAKKAFNEFKDEILKEGDLTAKEKELIVLVSASVLRAKPCVRKHIKTALEIGWSKKEIASALAVAWNTCGATQLYWADDKLDELIEEKWYKKFLPNAGLAFSKFHKEVFDNSPLDKKLLELIAFAVSNLMHCKHCLEAHATKAKEHGATKQQLAEAIGVAWLYASGSQIAWMKEDFEELLG